MRRLLIIPVIFVINFTDTCKINAENNEKICVNYINNIDTDFHELVISLCQYLEIDSITIIITYLPDQLDKIYKGVTISDDDGTFIIYLNKLYASSYEHTLVHELVHVKQYMGGALKSVDQRKCIYNDELINLDKVRYGKRPFEEDAFERSRQIIADLKM